MTFLESSSQDGKTLELSILIDTSQKDGRLLIFDQHYQVQFSSHWSHPERHTDRILSEFKRSKHLLSVHKLVKIYFISGPGSFTGLRVGAAFIKTLGLVYRNQPIYCINSFRITASHVKNKFEILETFSVCISSIGSMVFKADYEYANNVFQKEKIYEEGAIKFKESKNKVFSPNREMPNKHPQVIHVELDEDDYLEAVKNLDLDMPSAKIYTHLDLYPLYLRKSEAEEKYSYDKIKL